jgi:transcriptional regulator with XRE-family HTH domain
MENAPAITAALAEVGPRLKRARAQRDVTLTELAAATGISKSTLSRLEAGQRRPSLELLLPIAQAHQIPLGELVGAPEVGDPRVRFTPRNRNGRTVIPVACRPGRPSSRRSPANPNFAPTRGTNGSTCSPDTYA